jgi:hypothetical protein
MSCFLSVIGRQSIQGYSQGAGEGLLERQVGDCDLDSQSQLDLKEL